MQRQSKRVRFLLGLSLGWLGLNCASAAPAIRVAAKQTGAPTSTVAKIRKAGRVRCGVVSTPEDWNKIDLHGPLAPLDLEICKAVAVAVLGAKPDPATLVESHTFASELEAEEALSKGAEDLIVGVTPDATSMWHWNITFGPAVFLDGQGVLVRREMTAKTLNDLSGHMVCVVEGTDNEKILRARTVGQGMDVHPFDFQEEGEMDDAVSVRHCDAVSAYASRLVALQRDYEKELGQDRMLPDLLTIAPIAPAYRQGDAQWGMIVDWTVYALIQAEASGVTQANVSGQGANEDVVVQRLVGVDWAMSRALGLPAKDWAAQVIASVGNYGEIYERSLGSKSALRMPRGINALWVNGGLLHSMPLQ